MSFLSVLFLWGLPLTAIPVIIHLLNRRRRTVVLWGATRFLLEAAPQRRRRFIPADLLLMLLRLLVIAAIVLALARPMIRSTWFGTVGRRDVIVVLDTSMSTARRDGQVTRFEQIREAAEELIDDLHADDTIRVLLASSSPRWLTPGAVMATPETRASLKAQLADLAPTLADADLMRCVQEALDADTIDGASFRAVAILTDGQYHGWGLRTAESWSAIGEKLAAMEHPATINARLIGRQNHEPTNLSVESVSALRTTVGPDEAVTVLAMLRNTGTVVTDATLLRWSVDGEDIAATPIEPLEPGQTTEVDIEHVFSAPGVHDVAVRVDIVDDLQPDNVGNLIVEVVDAIAVLVVDGSRRRDPARTDTGYLLAALGRRSGGRSQAWKSVFRPTVIEPAALIDEPLALYNCVVLANVKRLDEQAVAGLGEFVRQGGGLWIVLADQTDREFFNEHLFAGGAGLSPLPLTDPIGDPVNRQRSDFVYPPAAYHPATRVLGDAERVDIDQIRIFRRHCFDPAAETPHLSVLLRTGHGRPLVVEKGVGRGRVIVQAIGLDIRWSNWPACQAFVVATHEWLWYLAEPTLARRNLHMGEPIRFTRPGGAAPPAVTVRTPYGTSIEVAPQFHTDRVVYSYTGMHCPGRYELTVTPQGAPEQTLPYYVRRNADESDLISLTPLDKRTLAAEAAVTFGADPFADVGPQLARAEPMWSWLLMALLALLVIETLLAAWLTRRRLAPAAAAVMGADVILDGGAV